MKLTNSFRTRAVRTAAAVLALGAVIAIPTPRGDAQAECRDVVSFARAQAAVGKVDARSGAALPVPAVYSEALYDSIPSVAYNQSGPSTTGQLEDPTGTNPATLIPTAFGFMPITPPIEDPQPFPEGTPFIPAPPVVGRSEAAYPTLEGIPQDSVNRFGSQDSEAHAYPTYSSGRASGAGAGDAQGGARGSSAWTIATLECETLTLVMGWSASGILVGGERIPSMSQIATLVVSPDGSSVDIATNIAQETESGIPIDGRPTDELTADFNTQGTYADAGEPRIIIEDDYVRVEGGGVRYGSADPSRNDTYTFYNIGSMAGEVRFLTTLAPVVQGPTVTTPPVTAAPVPAKPAVAARPPETRTITRVTESAGTPPAPSETATAQAEQFRDVQLAGVTEDMTTGSFSMLPFLLALIVISLISWSSWTAADHGREMFPTAGFAVDWLRDRGQRFKTSYLKW